MCSYPRLKELPPDCRDRILGFLPDDGSDPNVRGGGVSAFEVERQVKRRREELTEKWAKKITEAFLKISLGNPAPEGLVGPAHPPLDLYERFIEEPLETTIGPDGEVIPCEECMDWWTLPELKAKVEALGYKWTEHQLPVDRARRRAKGNLTEIERRLGFKVGEIKIRRTSGAEE